MDAGAMTEAGALRRILQRYFEIVRHAAPQFAWEEWALIADANSGAALVDELLGVGPRSAVTMLLANVESYIEDGGDRRWPVDSDALRARLGELPFVGQIAVLDVLERMWAQPQSDWPALLRGWRLLTGGAGAGFVSEGGALAS
jgi:hypothetical protein